MCSILTATHRVVYQPTRRALLGNGAKQGLTDQILGHALAHRVADQIAGKHILVACQAKPALIGLK